MIGSDLSEQEPFSVRRVEPAAFAPLVEHFKKSCPDTNRIIVEPDEKRDRLLADYRTLFGEQVSHDLDYNLQHMRLWAEHLNSRAPVLSDGRVQDAFRRLNDLRQTLLENDMWSGNRVELLCWNATQQFYCDSLALGNRLLRYEKGQRLDKRSSNNLRRRQIVDGATAYGFTQALANAFGQAIPNLSNLRPFQCVLPWLFYTGASWVLPRPLFSWLALLQHSRRLITSGGLAGLACVEGNVYELRGLKEFLADDYFFDPRTRRTRHNIILAFSHRHSVLDFPYLATALRGLDHAVMGNEVYLPKSANRDPRTVLVRVGQGRSLAPALARCAEVLVDLRLPLLIAVDGGGPYLLYGQQMRIKRGVRLITEYVKQYARNTGRKTYIVPLSLNDVVCFLRGLDPYVQITFHQPICSEDIAPVPDVPDPKRLNWGDPLLNHLELHFLVNTGQVRHGWQTPRVIDTIRRVNRELNNDHTFRGWLRRRLHPAIFDLCRDIST